MSLGGRSLFRGLVGDQKMWREFMLMRGEAGVDLRLRKVWKREQSPQEERHHLNIIIKSQTEEESNERSGEKDGPHFTWSLWPIHHLTETKTRLSSVWRLRLWVPIHVVACWKREGGLACLEWLSSAPQWAAVRRFRLIVEILTLNCPLHSFELWGLGFSSVCIVRCLADVCLSAQSSNCGYCC